ncbi:unnamed protein product, partial [Owenia fusiformis]
QIVNLTFHDFDVESHPDCEFDNVSLMDSYGTIEPSLCGYGIPSNIKSRDKWMLVELHTDGELARPGFYASFEAIDKIENDTFSMTTVAQASTLSTECGHPVYLNESSGDFASPGYTADSNSTYPHSTVCEWEIYVNEGMVIELTFNVFELE